MLSAWPAALGAVVMVMLLLLPGRTDSQGVNDTTVCNSTIDLAFVVDSSGSICNNPPSNTTTCSNWQFVVEFVQKIVEGMTIGPSDTHVGLVTFSTSVTVRWNLTRYTNKQDLLEAIKALPFENGNTNTTGALNVLRTQLFNTIGDRPDINNTAIIITDGKPTDNTTVEAAINATHDSGIRTLVVGVTDAVDEETLKLLSSPPQEKGRTYFVTEDFNTTQEILPELTTLTCDPNATVAPSPSSSSSPTATPMPTAASPTTQQFTTIPRHFCNSTIDLAFVIDSSGSICNDTNPGPIGCPNWWFVVDFVYFMVGNLTMGQSDVRVALVTFASSAKLHWNLTRYSNRQDLLDAIKALPYEGGNTDTTGALIILNTQVFNTVADRPVINNTAIIITDGKPTNISTVGAAIDAVHKSGIRTLVVGVTDAVDEETLKWLSSPPQEKGLTYFVTEDFRNIYQIIPQLTNVTCYPNATVPPSPSSITTNIATTSRSQQTATVPATCFKMDLCFLVDRSGSICDNNGFNFDKDQTCDNWKSTIQFISDVVSGLVVGLDNFRVALVTFSTSAHIEWDLTRYQDKDRLLEAIRNLTYVKGGTTDTTGGLNLMMNGIFNANSVRPQVDKVAIIITDGKPTDPSTVQAAIVAVHASRIRTLAVGVTDQIDEDTLRKLSSPPSQVGITYFMATDYETIRELTPKLQSQVCNQVVTPTSSSNPLLCTDLLDLALVVDGSGSICDNDTNFVYSRDSTCQNWNFTVQFLHQIVDKLNVSPSLTRVAMVIFSSTARLAWNLSTYSDKSSIIYAIDKMMYVKGGTTDTTGALNIVRTQVFLPGDRPEASKMAIIVTDGKPTEPSTVKDAIDALHMNGVKTLAIGVTKFIDERTIKELSSEPKMLNVNYFIAKDYSTINGVVEQLEAQTCYTTPVIYGQPTINPILRGDPTLPTPL